VAASVCQSAPALAIFEPGSACGIPYAPELGFEALGFEALGFEALGFEALGFEALGFEALGFEALTFQPLSLFHSESRHENWPDDQP
jgi:hypothetical protein